MRSFLGRSKCFIDIQMPTAKLNSFAPLKPISIVQVSLKTKKKDINSIINSKKPQGPDYISHR